MRADVSRHLVDCRRRGLFVDEDFERGSTWLRQATHAALLAALVTAIILTLLAVIHPAIIDATVDRIGALSASFFSFQRREPANASRDRGRIDCGRHRCLGSADLIGRANSAD